MGQRLQGDSLEGPQLPLEDNPLGLWASQPGGQPQRQEASAGAISGGLIPPVAGSETLGATGWWPRGVQRTCLLGRHRVGVVGEGAQALLEAGQGPQSLMQGCSRQGGKCWRPRSAQATPLPLQLGVPGSSGPGGAAPGGRHSLVPGDLLGSRAEAVSTHTESLARSKPRLHVTTR